MPVPTRKYGQFVAGEFVEVRPLYEILATLDERGALEGVPFMPEMAPHCGKRYEVWKRADKTCDEGRGGAIRRLEGTVHLKELRCDGSAHGGCDAGCLFFWKEQWLKRAGEPNLEFAGGRSWTGLGAQCTVEGLLRATHHPQTREDEAVFSCQATQVRAFTTPLKWWDLRQYARDIGTRNVGLVEFFVGLWIGAFNKIQQLRNRGAFRSTVGTNKKTPQANLNLAPGDLVQIKSSAEIGATLDAKGRNTGLSFRPAMVPFCGKQYRVLRRVNRIISAETGKMLQLGGRCVILEGVVCIGAVRRFCPRMVYQYWRDIWLTRVEPEQCAASAPGSDEITLIMEPHSETVPISRETGVAAVATASCTEAKPAQVAEREVGAK